MRAKTVKRAKRKRARMSRSKSKSRALVPIQAAIAARPKSEVMGLTEYGVKHEMLAKFVKRYLMKSKDGKCEGDYGTIKGCGNRLVLFKSGAEKLAELYRFGTKMMCMKEEEDFAKPFFAYTYRCEVFHIEKAELVIASCEASANSRESKFRSAPNNTVRKMAQKRAYVGVMIMATRSSQWFTQDMDDRSISGEENTQESSKNLERTRAEQRVHILAGEVGIQKPELAAWLKKTFGDESTKKLQDDDLNNLISHLLRCREMVGLAGQLGFGIDVLKETIKDRFKVEGWLGISTADVKTMITKAQKSLLQAHDKKRASADEVAKEAVNAKA